MILAVDFDGTLCDHRYPDIGAEVPGAFRWLARFQAAGVRLVLWTMRSDETLDDAVRWCRDRGVEFWTVNANPQQAAWTGSPKVYAHAYIDDAAIGCPLRDNPRMGGRPFVDWEKVGPAVAAMLPPAPDSR